MIERDVAELRARVMKLEWTVEQLTRQLGIQIAPAPRPGGVSSAVLALVRGGDKLAAIKAHVAETGADLATAKKLIDSLE
jgi:ribosomal protein L7/L12